ncbi:MAG: thioredoxin-like domain-containing protein [Bacteroidota bacterium]|nr:thioredoxin-like domain-containing protein [Bacteroidota bacterium]
MKTLQQTYRLGRAPELLGDFWFNSEPLSVHQLQGQPILLFFWDYTLQQSLKLIPFMNGLHSLYVEYGLVCVGVHSPEFFFEKDSANVEATIKKNMILFPVMTDNDRLVTNAYRISSLPTLCLIDHKGEIYDLISEAIIPERIERSVQYLLRQSGYRGELPLLLNPEFDKRYFLSDESPHQIYTGYSHGSFGNPEGYSPELPAEYVDPKIYFESKFYAHGIWCAERNAFRYEGNPNEGYLICQSDEENVTIVAGSKTKASVKVELDDAPIQISIMGNDMQKEKKGTTYFTVDDPRLISVLQNNRRISHSVKFIPSASGVTFYMFAFDSKQTKNSEPSTSIRNN